MAKDAKRIPIHSNDDLARILDEVREDRLPRIVERDGKPVAAVIGIDDLHKVLEGAPTEEEVASAFEAAGSWSDVDPEGLKRSIRESRRAGTRPASRPA